MFWKPPDADEMRMIAHRIVMTDPGLRALGVEVLNKEVMEDALSRRSPRLLAREPFVPGGTLGMKGVRSEGSVLSAISASPYWLSGGGCDAIAGIVRLSNWANWSLYEPVYLPASLGDMPLFRCAPLIMY